MNRYAYISKDEKHVYWLKRSWGNETNTSLTWILFNPPIGNEYKEDATLRRIVAFSKSFGYDGFSVVNLFSYRTSDPSKLKMLYLSNQYSSAELHGGLPNDKIIEEYTNVASMVICAWGGMGSFLQRDEQVVTHLLCDCTLYCLETDRLNQPKHPLYLPKHLKPKLWQIV